MLPLAPLLLLAYAALYAFAYAIPNGYKQLDVRDALALPEVKVAVADIQARTPETKPEIETAPIVVKVKRSVDYTTLAGPPKMAGQGPIMSGGHATLHPGEGQGFWHRCSGDRC